MEIKAIEYIKAVAEEKSYTRAAGKLFISQPALSQYIKKLEELLNVTFFVRSTKALELTAAGEMVVQEGTLILEQRRQLLQKLHDLSRAHKETIRFGISPFYSKYYLPKVLPRFSAQYPNIRLEITEEISVVLEQMTLSGSLDFCFVPEDPQNPLLNYRTVCVEEIYIAVPSNHPVNSLAIPSTGVPYLELSHLRTERFIMLKPRQKFLYMCEQLLESAGIQPEIAYETLNWDTIHVMVAGGIGVGFVPEVLVKSSFIDKRPRYYRIAGMNAKRAYAVAIPKESTLPFPASQLIEMLIQTLQ